jgi:hypothetical protein
MCTLQRRLCFASFFKNCRVFLQSYFFYRHTMINNGGGGGGGGSKHWLMPLVPKRNRVYATSVRRRGFFPTYYSPRFYSVSRSIHLRPGDTMLCVFSNRLERMDIEGQTTFVPMPLTGNRRQDRIPLSIAYKFCNSGSNPVNIFRHTNLDVLMNRRDLIHYSVVLCTDHFDEDASLGLIAIPCCSDNEDDDDDDDDGESETEDVDG